MAANNSRSWIATAVALLGGCHDTGPDDSPRIPAVQLGVEQTLLGPGQLGLTFMPDEALCVVRRQPDVALVAAGSGVSYLLTGPGLDQLNQAVVVLEPGSSGSFDNGYAGISGCQRLADGRLFAIYHAEDHEGMEELPGGIPGFYAVIAGAVSDDDGASWQKLGPLISSNKPKDWAAYLGQGDRGVATPSLALDREGKYLYIYYDDHSRVVGGRVVFGVARAEFAGAPPGPGSWYKYRDGQFSEPGLGGLETPILHMVDANADVLQPHVVYSDELECYLMVLGVLPVDEYVGGAPLSQGGMYLASSSDGIHWSTPQQLLRDYACPLTGESLSWESTILWDVDSTARGWLVYGHTPTWASPPPYLVGRRISFAR
jgi:hypothetical protein